MLRERFYVSFCWLAIVAFSMLESQALASSKPQITALPQVECATPARFSKAQRENLIYAYNFGAPRGMGYTMAAIAWKESCAGAYMLNFSDPSAGLYHAHIPVVLKYYSSYKDSAFTRNVIGQILIDDRAFASKVALDSLLYWHGYHKGNHKNIIKSYNKGFKWEKDSASDKLAESYYLDIARKIRLLESYIPRFSRVKNQSTLLEMQDKNKNLLAQQQALQNVQSAPNMPKSPPPKSPQNLTRSASQPKSQPSPAPKNPTQSKQNPANKSQPTRESNTKNHKNTTKPSQQNRPQNTQQNTGQSPKPHNYANEFVDLPLEGGLNGGGMSGGANRSGNGTLDSGGGNFDDNFEDFTLIFEGH